MRLDDRLSGEIAEPTLSIDARPWRAIVGWSRSTDLEVSGLGLLTPHDGGFRMTDAYLLRQSATAYETELEPADVAALVGRLVEEGVDPAGLRVWWHSHARETPFWSGVDERTIAGFAPVAMVSLVLDHRLKRLARLDRFESRQTAWVHLCLPEGGEEPARGSAYGAEVDRMVTAAGAVARPGNEGHGGGGR